MSESRDFAALIPTPKFAVGTKLSYRKVGEAEVVGYRITHDTDTAVTKVAYIIGYRLMGQWMRVEVPQSTIDRALAWKCDHCGALVAPGIACPTDGTKAA